MDYYSAPPAVQQVEEEALAMGSLKTEVEDHDDGSVSTSSTPSSPKTNKKTDEVEGSEEQNDDDDEEMTWSIALHPRNMFKLVTAEDKFHLHKLVGVFCLTHYIFRFVSLLVTGSMGFEQHSAAKIVFFFLMHALLSWSSLIFHLPQRRNRVKPMIWPELRLHNIAFATRSIADAIIHTVFEDVFVKRGLLFVATVVTMYAADRISDHYRRLELITKQDSTMRSMPWPNDASAKLIAAVNLYYALSQIFATVGVLNVSKRWATDVEFALTTLFAIQVSALLMTLVRKSILGNYAWHFWYQVALGLSWVLLLYRFQQRSPLPVVIFRACVGGFIAYHLRFRFEMNKYAMWTLFAVLDAFLLDAIRHMDPSLLPIKPW